jgi:hypothetical protein
MKIGPALVALLSMISSPAARGVWSIIGEIDTATAYIDSARIIKNDHLRRTLTLIDIKPGSGSEGPNGELSARHLEQLNCDTRKVQLLSFTTHPADCRHHRGRFGGCVLRSSELSMSSITASLLRRFWARRDT